MRDHDRVVVEARRRCAIWAGSAAVIVYAVTVVHRDRRRADRRDGRRLLRRSHGRDDLLDRDGAALFVYAARLSKTERSLPIGGGLALVAAAMAKLFLFDLGTLDGIFRVVVFIVVGLVLLGMGAGYARLLERQDQQQDQTGVTGATQ